MKTAPSLPTSKPRAALPRSVAGKRNFLAGIAIWALALAMAAQVDAAMIMGVQLGNSNLVAVDSLTGAITNVGALPAGRNALDHIQGLSGTGYGTLVYTDGTTLGGVFELNPLNGAVITTYALPGVTIRGGLSYHSGTLYSANNGSPVVSQAGLGGPVNLTFSSLSMPFPGALGGDGFGRLFAASGLGGSSIKELNLASGAILNSFALPGAAIASGLAYDGAFLYASTLASNALYTLNPNTGAVVSQTTYTGGSLTALAFVPEPTSGLLLLGSGTMLLLRRRRTAN